jgi:hypothetical protein
LFSTRNSPYTEIACATHERRSGRLTLGGVARSPFPNGTSVPHSKRLVLDRNQNQSLCDKERSNGAAPLAFLNAFTAPVSTEHKRQESNKASDEAHAVGDVLVFHRALAPLAAIWVRFLAGSAAALASPPLRPSATAAGSFLAGGSVFLDSPMDSRNTCRASWIGSRGRLVAMPRVCHA